ncbi:MAG TPA: hypothetical protein VEX62_06395 [Candidatus Limnocylindrales bacterium]|nr:hypothetical protein [Candidatus Limnocylindrales bacterium]
MRIARLLLVSAAVLVAAACTSITIPGQSPGTTIPPIPSLPSFQIPSFQLPSNLPSIPPIGVPTVAPGGATSGGCALVTEAEMTSIMGQAMSATSSSPTECTWSAPSVLPTVTLRFDSGESIATGKMIATTNGQDLTIGGFPAYYGEFMGSLMWIEKNGRTLTLQAIWSESGDPAVQKLSQIGTLAIGRF